MNNTKEAEEVSLHAAAVKNQLVLSLTVIMKYEKTASKTMNGINKYLRKYDGTLYVTETPIEQSDFIQGQAVAQKIIIGLRRN